MSEIYDISNYSREDLYNILEVSSPTDSELEAKIIQLMQKYKNGSNKESEKMLVFFSEIYKFTSLAKCPILLDGNFPNLIRKKMEQILINIKIGK